MRLAADANALVGESLRARGRRLIAHDDLDLFIAPPTWSETVYEVRRRLHDMLRHGQVDPLEHDEILSEALATLAGHVTIVGQSEYRGHEAEARDRTPRDPNDWPTVALAMALGIGIWTVDGDFFGCGVPVWTTQTLLTHVETGRAGQTQ